MTKNFKKFGLVLALSLFAISSVVYAGTLTPSAAPAATSYTLTDIYTRLTTNASATLGNHDFVPSGSPGASLYTLTQLYDAIPTIDASKILTGTTYLGIDGTIADNGAFSLTASTSDQAVTAGYYSGGTLSGDADLVTGNIKSGITIFGVSGDSNVVDTSTGDAAAGDILSGKIAWVDGSEITGTIATQTLSAGSDTVSAGYYDTTTLSTVDTDLTAANILSGTTIFGVAGSASSGYTYGDDNAALVLGTATGAGTALLNLWNGTSGAFTGGSQANGGMDDYNNNGTRPSDTYSKGWTACNAGNSYCGTSDSGADAKDDSTGLIWSMPCNGSGCASFSDAAPLTYSWDSSAVNNNSRTASQLCSDHAGWSLPHQKQLMQAYIDGSWGNLEGVPRSYWSASTVSNFTTSAWATTLSLGSTYTTAKTNSFYVRCVRLAS